MQRLGIVDLGSNTARLVVFSFEQGQWFRLAFDRDLIVEPIIRSREERPQSQP